MNIICLACAKDIQAARPTKRFCSTKCYQRYRHGFPKERACRECGKVFPLIPRGDHNRQHCSQRCAKKHNTKRIAEWKEEHYSELLDYWRERNAKPQTKEALVRKARTERLEAIRLLGGACYVCGVTSPCWLHVDFIPTTRNTPYRHPRHLRYVATHLHEFRLLCANHHYELTLTGTIEGTDITQ